MSIISEINTLRQERQAVILAHTYQDGSVQDIADFVGDSYGLSVKATQVPNAKVIVFCGVSFMAESAAILNPDKTVIMPDATAGCEMADMITGQQLREFKAKHPGAKVVCYVNSTAEVKAESDICCTSSNAVKVIRSLGTDCEVLFVPDSRLGRFVEKQLNRPIICWDGGCPVHYGLKPETIREMKNQYPGYAVMVHPETNPDTQAEADYVLSTGDMIELAKKSDQTQFLVGTEIGIMHALKKACPGKSFVHIAPSQLICRSMKQTTLENIKRSLETLQTPVTVPEEIASKARLAIQAMLAVK